MSTAMYRQQSQYARRTFYQSLRNSAPSYHVFRFSLSFISELPRIVGIDAFVRCVSREFVVWLDEKLSEYLFAFSVGRNPDL